MDIKKVIILIIVAFIAGYLVRAASQAPLDASFVSVTKPAQDMSSEQELGAIDIGNVDADFAPVEADLGTL